MLPVNLQSESPTLHYTLLSLLSVDLLRCFDLRRVNIAFLHSLHLANAFIQSHIHNCFIIPCK